jgi:hypothetical protein
MSEEESEFWRKYKEAGKEKKAKNEEYSIWLLKDYGIKFEVLDVYSKHYKVGEFSFWPTTGKFYNPKTGEKGRGVKNLIKKLYGKDTK